ncbi:MAG: chemotaxis protein CheW [Phycisphaerales bacterium]
MDPEGTIIITEFNTVGIGFLVDEVERSHRLSWTELLPIPTLKIADADGAKIGCTTGALDIDGRLILMVDFESVAKAVLMQDKLKIRSVENQLGVDRLISGEALDQPNMGEVALQSA